MAMLGKLTWASANGGCPLAAEGGPQALAGKMLGLQSFIHRDMNSDNNLNELGSRFSPSGAISLMSTVTCSDGGKMHLGVDPCPQRTPLVLP